MLKGFLLLMLFLIIAALCWAFYAMLRRYRLRRYLLKHGAVAVAESVQEIAKPGTGGRTNIHQAIVTFSTGAGHNKISGKHVFTKKTMAKIRQNGAVKVYYDHKKPEKFLPEDSPHPKLGHLILCAVTCFLFLWYTISVVVFSYY